MTISIEHVWALLQQHQQETFYTAKGLPFTYTIRGRELFVDRRQKSITISTVEKALEKIGRLQADGIAITGPKKIGCYGASYLYPVLLALGNIKGKVVDRPKALGDIRGVTYIYGMFYRFGLIDVPDEVKEKIKHPKKNTEKQ